MSPSANPRQRPAGVCLALTKTVEQAVDSLEAVGCEATWDRASGTVVVHDDGTRVYAALQKGRNQPWIVSCYNSDRITWPKKEI